MWAKGHQGPILGNLLTLWRAPTAELPPQR